MVDITKYAHKLVTDALIDEDDRLKLTLNNNEIVYVYDDGQSCCEHRYMSTNDDVTDLVGGLLLSVTEKPVPDGGTHAEDDDSWGMYTNQCSWKCKQQKASLL